MGILQQIVAHKREELAGRRLRVPLEEIRARAADAPASRQFLEAVRSPGAAGRILTASGLSASGAGGVGAPDGLAPVRLIAEVKGTSPSAGTIRAAFDPAEIARAYAGAGAAAISVLTDERFFQGADEHLGAVRRVVPVPILRKDFTLDAYQVYEARAIGADAVLLIVSILSGGAIGDLQGLAADLGMAALVEVHTEAELEQALATRAPLVGLNNRNLDTLETSLDVTRRLRPLIAPGVVVVGESGIEERADVEEMAQLGVDAVLVGTALMRSSDPAARIRELLGTGG